MELYDSVFLKATQHISIKGFKNSIKTFSFKYKYKKMVCLQNPKHFSFSEGALSFTTGKMLGAGWHPTRPE